MRWILVFALTVALILDIGFARYAADQEIGSATKYRGVENYQQHTLDGPFILGAKDISLWFLDFAESNEGAITALSTFVIAVFTIILAFATKQLKDISDRQVNAFINTERPWMFIHKYKLRQRERADRMIPNNWYISFEWRNFGRTAAIVEESIAGIQDIDTMAKSPDYTKCSSFDMLATTVAASETCGTREFGPSIKTKNNGEHIRYVVYGRLTYRDLAGKRHHTGFAMEVWSVGAAASTHQNDKYEYWD